MKRAVLLFAAMAGVPAHPAVPGDAAPPAQGEAVSELRRLTQDPGPDAMPSWSPDGRRIVFHARHPPPKGDTLPTRKIWIVDRDGRNARRLSDGPGEEYHPAVSPEGSRIAFVSEANGSRDIWVMDAEGKNPLPLTDDPGLEDHPCWSPDGRRVVYAALPKDGGNFDLWVMNADGSGKRKVTFTAANEVFPAWHPQGQRIALATDVNGNFDLYTLSLPDEQLAPLVSGPSNDTRPAWSPDGSKIAFTRWPAEGRSRDATLWVANADGSVATELAVAAPAAHPSWAPDGRTLAFQRASDGDWNLWSARLPDDVVREGRLRLARQVRGRGGEDLVKLRRGETVHGAVVTPRFRLRTPYGLVELPRAVLASLQFDDMAKGTAKLVLGNGDTFSGLLLDDHIEVDGAAGRRNLRKEKIEAIGFRIESGRPEDRSGPARLWMRNGDSYSAALRTRGLRLRVGSQVVELPLADVARVEFAEEGKKSQVVTRKGDTLAGTLETPLLELDLPAGAYLALYPSYIRSLTLAEGLP